MKQFLFYLTIVIMWARVTELLKDTYNFDPIKDWTVYFGGCGILLETLC